VLLFLLSCVALGAQGVNPPAQPFYLHQGDTVVFYGDSITAQRHYTQLVATYVTTRFPHMQVTFYNAGVGGDRVSGGGGGPIDRRLARDVFPFRPNVVTIMLGMNDGSYRALDEKIESTYSQGYEHIVQSLQQTLPGVRLTLLGPSPYDEVTRPPNFPGGYNRSLIRFGEIDSQLAQKYHASYIDLNAPFVAALTRGQALSATGIQLLVPDRVHPELLAHWFMAEAILKGWGAQAIVSAVTIDAAKKAVVETENAHVTELEAAPQVPVQSATQSVPPIVTPTLSWTELDDALPLPVDDSNAGFRFLRQITDIVQSLDQQPLRILSLQPGSYELSIDGNKVGAYTDAEWARGVNLATLGTPMHGQANYVQWAISDRDTIHDARYLLLNSEEKSGFPAEPTASELLKFEAVQQKHIFELAEPKPHKFTLKPVAATP
jgi:lysophospholipase L1-like esterase